ncbi:MAG: hypothetical protein IPI46_12370 [Bacteroidetes bacterium]|nr:hypothetical protein [Bacteroidota bacterium]
MRKTRLSPFYQGPEWLNGTSSINLLKNRIGKSVNGFQTLKTGVISTKRATRYNGVSLKLQVVNDLVYLKVGKSLSDPYWKIDNIVKMLSFKNASKTILKQDVRKWIEDGKLVVSFNVLKKDHGTKWKLIDKDTLFKSAELKPRVKWERTKKEVLLDEDDFFSDL